MALHAGLRCRKRLAGLLAMSCYLPSPITLAAEKSAANSDVPALMCHGRMDPIVPIGMGRSSRCPRRVGVHFVEWHEYRCSTVCPQELV